MRRMVRGTRLVDVKRPEYDEPLKETTPQIVTLYVNGEAYAEGVEMFGPIERIEAGCTEEFPIGSRVFEKIVGDKKSRHFWGRWF